MTCELMFVWIGSDRVPYRHLRTDPVHRLTTPKQEYREAGEASSVCGGRPCTQTTTNRSTREEAELFTLHRTHGLLARSVPPIRLFRSPDLKSGSNLFL
ncbi:hypothetical protein PGTUg99_026743 [Puccinia graminis f. sp. tritici]|uniref:Uncharacterized protein n=1 Tax=Puccinia graminis f. sp. tritici TaxID=56615 RepID=A0A5B0RYA2_PUCGR|nr:hypothetical protein PGTUg99_026743 [Puccinia graminis f. sp. tritici]